MAILISSGLEEDVKADFKLNAFYIAMIVLALVLVFVFFVVVLSKYPVPGSNRRLWAHKTHTLTD